MNNYCIGVGGNEQSCAKCHIGFGVMGHEGIESTLPANVDCMVCHDNSAEYLKGSAMGGYPDRSVNFTKVAQSVGPPQNGNCGACHFYSGGGNNVKHGDLEEALLEADRTVDVHMGFDGGKMQCIACHTATNHQMKGRLYSVSSDDLHRGTCEQCHTATPHLHDVLDQHAARVACQTCHIPTYAKANATKMTWDWSTAGKLRDGEPYEVADSNGNHTYLSIKGDFTWATHVVPEYAWFNGFADHYLLGEKIDTADLPVQINALFGSHADPQAKIYPVKVHRGKQIYDAEYHTLIQPRLYAEHKGDSAYWQDFDWHLAAAAGMRDVSQPYSGHYGFVETEMYWPLNHMVAPADEALSCASCHTRKDGRLAALPDFYMPGRDRVDWLDTLGSALVWLVLLGVVSHILARIVLSYKSRRNHNA
ncbi:MAG: tetrathionate reductase family octaheme c-type cytochrome [Bacteroidia bacterium]